MSAKIIDGKAIAKDIHAEVRVEAEQFEKVNGYKPGLATVIVGEDPASQSYVRAKVKACEEDGLMGFKHVLPESASQEEVMALVTDLAQDPSVHGILVQLPLPSHIDEKTVLDAIPVYKDVDGFHPANLGRIGIKGEEADFVACTPSGVIELLKRSDVKIEGANAVVIGRSKIVGLPVALLLMNENATVTVCHSRTKDLGAVTREADILVPAIGKANLVTEDMVKEGAVIIDVGVNRVDDATRKRGYRLVGDCDFEGVSKKARAITPVPGGVGPMTIAMLMKNTLRAAKRQLGA
jgi:methylenetetrahydrofolate dehydrogenase (NADP+) / methenyltetrahydrofolate cyclohydrolase